MRDLEPPPSIVRLVDELRPDSIWKTWLNNLYSYVVGEPWHEVGATGEPAFQNSWANFGSNGFGDWSTVAFKKQGNTVKIKGFPASGVVILGDEIFNLPEGYRPPKVEMFASFTGNGTSPTGAMYTLVHPDGRVIAHSSFLDDWVTLSGIEFSVV